MTTPGDFSFFPIWESEILFRMNESQQVHIQSSKIDTAPVEFCLISGLTTEKTRAQFERMHFISVVLTPIALKALFKLPVNTLNNGFIEGKELILNIPEIEDTLQSNLHFYSKARWLENNLLKDIDTDVVIPYSRLVSKLTNSTSLYSSKEIEQMLGYSKTQTYRVFNEWFGLSTSQFQKILKFQNSLNQMHTADSSLTQVALDSGYYDQAHFIRNFKEFTGLTPRKYKALKTEIPGVFPL